MSNESNGFGGRSRKARLKVTTILAGAAAIAAASAPTTAASANDADDTIVVTGSRLQRSDLSAPSPTTVVGASDIAASGDVTLDKLLMEYPQLAASGTTNVNAGAGSPQGILTANLRGLGVTRTLVLVNGRRYISANGDGTVDLATIPSALVDRIEIITGGASAVYGSDAIAGAVNFILKDNFEGVSAAYQYGQTTKGDGQTHKADVTIGASFDDDRGNVVIHGSYSKRNSVFMGDRAFSETALNVVGGQLVPSGSGNIPGGRIGLSSGQLATVVGVPGLSCPSGQSLGGIRFGSSGEPLPYCAPQDSFNFAPLNYLQRPLDRWQLSGLGRYDLTDKIELFGEFHFADATNSFQQAEESFAVVTPGFPGLLVTNYATNPALSPATRDFLINNAHIFDADMDGDALVLGMGRRGDETGPRNYTFERQSFSATLGLRGDIGDTTWKWDVFGQFQRSRTASLTIGQYSLTRLALGLDAVDDGSGNAVCRVQILGCVPVNPFGLGSISEAAGAFIATNRTSKSIFERSILGGVVTGELFQLPAGAVPLALGFEYRQDDFNFTPGATDLGGEYGSGSIGITAGSYNVKEFFGEVRIPILADVTFFETLAIEGAVRYSDYSNFGSAITWKVMGEWAPVDWLRFRAAYNRALRAPTLNELFSPRAEGFTSGDDPCDIDNNPTSAMQALCVTQGVAPGDIATFQQLDIGFLQSSGGNPSLEEERSKALTIGAVIRPPLVPGLNLTADYYTIEVEDAIAQIGAQQIVNTCFALLDNSSAPCQAIERLPNGQLRLVRANINNIGFLKVRGVDAQADYRFDLPGALALSGEGAQLTLAAAAGWVFENSNQVVGAAPRDCAGYFAGGCTGQSVLALPDFKLTSNVTYQSGPLTARVQVRHIGGLDPFPGVSTTVEAPAVTYVDLSAAVRLHNKVEIFGGIDNIADVQPPILGFNFGGDANTDPVLWDVIGRRFFMGVRANL